jgi:hypothetical protein
MWMWFGREGDGWWFVRVNFRVFLLYLLVFFIIRLNIGLAGLVCSSLTGFKFFKLKLN